jgi:hypothetical protein
MQNIREKHIEIYSKLKGIAFESGKTSRAIYFDLIKLFIIVSVGALPLIGIIIITQDIKSVTFLILVVMLFLIFSIAFGITSLIGHGIHFKKHNNDAANLLKEMLLAEERGEQHLEKWLLDNEKKLKNLEHGNKTLDYKLSIFQLSSFILALLILFLAICKILYTP